VAGLDPVVGGLLHPLGAGRVSPHLLLLPRRVLQGVLGRPAELLGGGATEEVPRRALVPAHPAERPSLLPLPRARVPRLPRARRLGGDVVHRCRDGRQDLRHRSRHPGARGQHGPPLRATPSVATRCATSSAAASISSRKRRRGSRRTAASAASTAATCCGRG
jgi:hypothetical protein